MYLLKINLGRVSGNPSNLCVWKEPNADLRLKYCCPKRNLGKASGGLFRFYSLEKSGTNVRLKYFCPKQFWAEPPADPPAFCVR